jgi:rubrerythrin
MKKAILSIFVLAGFSVLVLNSSCNSKAKEEKKEEMNIKADSVTSHRDSVKVQAYVCPMGPQCGQGDKPGKCPSCGMDLKENPDFKKK